MLYIFFAILSSVGVIHLLKLGSLRRIPRFPLFAVNYAVAFGAGFVRTDAPTSLSGLPPGYWLLAISVGVAFVVAFFALSRAVAEAGPSLATTVSRLAVAIPVGVSILAFGEATTVKQLIGILLTLAVLPLASGGAAEAPQEGGRGGARAFFSLLILFLLFGFNDVVFKMREEFYTGLDERAFTTILFGTSLLLTTFFALRRRAAITGETVGIGLLLGIVNYFSAYWIIRALGVLPGFLVYPVNSIGIIVVATATSVVLWRERPRPRHYVFYAGALGAVYLLA